MVFSLAQDYYKLLKVTLTEKSFQGKGSCESPKRDKWRYASVPVNKQPMRAL